MTSSERSFRVALACPYAWDAPGGVQVHVAELAEHLRERGHQVLVVAPSRSEPAQPWVHVVGRPVDIPYNASVAPICPWPSSSRRVRDALAAFAPDVLHAHEPLTPSTSLFAVRSAGVPVVATFHSGASRALLYDLAAPVLRREARRIDVRVAVSRAAAAFAGRRIGGAFRIVGNGVNVERFRDASPASLPGVPGGAQDGKVVLFVGRLDERKGFPTAVEAFARLAADDPTVRLVVAGDGPDRSAVETLGSDVRSRVSMLGHVPNAELPSVTAACDAFVGSSVGGESFGVVLVEAMAAGLPVVASRIPGYDEVISDGVDGLLVGPRDPAATAEALARVLGEPSLSARLAAAGKRRAASFSWEVIAGHLVACYEEAITAARARAPRC
ncbi:MAG: glycosyltransferase family 4 protein [Actinomycetota bacterium]